MPALCRRSGEVETAAGVGSVISRRGADRDAGDEQGRERQPPPRFTRTTSWGGDGALLSAGNRGHLGSSRHGERSARGWHVRLGGGIGRKSGSPSLVR